MLCSFQVCSRVTHVFLFRVFSNLVDDKIRNLL